MKPVSATTTSSIVAFSGSVLLLMGWAARGPSAIAMTQTRAPASTPADIVKLDPALDRIVPAGASIEKISGGFRFTEGPIWSRDGALVFSDMNAQVVYKVTRSGERSVVRKFDAGPESSPRPNGLGFDKQGRLLICEMGNRRIVRLEKTGELTVIAEKYEGKRLNSPDDLIVKSDGSIYFTDPPYGLAKRDDDPNKELNFNGVLRLVHGDVELLTTELSRPNGLAFSPREKYLYVSNTEGPRIIKRFEVKRDGRLGAGSLFYDYEASVDKRPGALDGLKTDREGNVYATGPGGVLILSPAGKLLGQIGVPEATANVAWGEEGNTLYVTARTSIYRIRLSARGAKP
jgi:gluconolactonase